jgi:hypothetical protein
MASVVISRPAMEAASCNAVRTHLAPPLEGQRFDKRVTGAGIAN